MVVVNQDGKCFQTISRELQAFLSACVRSNLFIMTQILRVILCWGYENFNSIIRYLTLLKLNVSWPVGKKFVYQLLVAIYNKRKKIVYVQTYSVKKLLCLRLVWIRFRKVNPVSSTYYHYFIQDQRKIGLHAWASITANNNNGVPGFRGGDNKYSVRHGDDRRNRWDCD